MCLACGSGDQLLLPLSQIPCCVHQLYHLRLGCLPLLPQTQSKSSTQEIKWTFCIFTSFIKRGFSFLLLMTVSLPLGFMCFSTVCLYFGYCRQVNVIKITMSSMSNSNYNAFFGETHGTYQNSLPPIHCSCCCFCFSESVVKKSEAYCEYFLY